MTASEKVQEIILQELQKGPASGTEIMDRTMLGCSSVYPTLRLMERNGTLVSRRELAEGGGRHRTYYEIAQKSSTCPHLHLKSTVEAGVMNVGDRVVPLVVNVLCQDCGLLRGEVMDFQGFKV